MLDTLIPAPRKIEESAVNLGAVPGAVWDHLRHGDLVDSPLVRALFMLRTFPARLRATAGAAEPLRVRVDDFRSTPEQPGFQLLGEDPPHEFAVGAIGKVFQLDIPFVHVDGPEAYTKFDEPGWVKVAWAVRVEPLGATASRVVLQVRVDATDDTSWTKFEHYWRLIGPGSHFVRHALLTGLSRRFGDVDEHEEALRDLAARAEARPARDTLRDVAAGVGGAAIMAATWLTAFMRPARSHWGQSDAEAKRARPGDELVVEARWSWTHAIEVDAPAEQVWPWVAQVGADRAGFYSYQWLENVVGCNLRNADAIHPEWAHRAGDALVLHPKMPPLRVVSVVPGQSLVAFAAPDETARAEGRPWFAASWAFLVEPLSEARCRVVSRFRSACSDDAATRLTQGPLLLEPVGFAMDRRMLLGIRERVRGAEGRRQHLSSV